jgi:hypothetical protein
MKFGHDADKYCFPAVSDGVAQIAWTHNRSVKETVYRNGLS